MHELVEQAPSLGHTIGLTAVRRRLAARPLAVWALGLLGLESLLAIAGASWPALSVAVLLLAPGLMLLPLAPARVRAQPLAALALAPALGFAASGVALITLARAGIRLDGTSARVAVLVLVLVGLALSGERELGRGVRALELLGLVGAVGLGIVLQSRVIGGARLPGNDWAKYVLYADEIRRHGALLIRNPFWMLGVPFREDPGVPALYGAFLAMTRAPAALVGHGIWVFSVLGILSMFGFVRAFWGGLAAVVAAALLAVLPISQDILGWHGLANVAALALMPLVLLFATQLLREGLDARTAGGLGLVLVALAATHRLSFLVALAGLAVALAFGLLAGRRAPVARGAALVALATLVISPGVLLDLLARQRTFGGTQPYTAYLGTKLNLGGALGDLTIPFVVAVVLALALLGIRRARPPGLAPVLALLAVVVALTFAWIVHLPLAYLRLAYYLPLALVPLVAAVMVRALPRRGAAALAAVLVAVIGVLAWRQDAKVRTFYEFADRASLRGLDAVSARLRPGEVVATDRCWSFLATWLLHTRTLPALEPADIGPGAEVPVARRARAVLAGTPAGLADARRLGVRYMLVDPTCTDVNGRPLTPPVAGVPLYASDRLAVLALRSRER